MQHSLWKIVITTVLIFALTGCGSAPVYNVEEAPVISMGDTKATKEDVKRAIVRSGAVLGWKMRPVKDGVIKGTLNLRKHEAIIEITYDANSYNITYKESIALDYNSEKNTIHSNYNGWIQRLERTINADLSTL